MIDEKRIAEIQERTDAATSGPWRNVVLGNTVKSLQIISHSVCKKICSGISPKSKDAEFIIHAREDIPYLLDLISEFQRRELATIQDIHVCCPTCIHCAKPICPGGKCSFQGYEYWKWRGPKEVEK
jgi:hypothetical protein